MTDVVALGELLIDFTNVAADPEGYPTMAAHPGGAPANFLAALSQFGCKTAFLGKVGTDVLKNLQCTGVSLPCQALHHLQFFRRGQGIFQSDSRLGC